MTEDLTKMTDVELLSRAITKSGLSVRQFANDVLIRDDRTVHRWLAGDQALPHQVRHWLERDEPSPAAMRTLLQEMVSRFDHDDGLETSGEILRSVVDRARALLG